MKIAVGLNLFCLLCWIVMFLTATDVWHFTGRPDVWGSSGPPYHDLRAFTFAFYLQFLALAAAVGIGTWSALRSRGAEKGIAA